MKTEFVIRDMLNRYFYMYRYAEIKHSKVNTFRIILNLKFHCKCRKYLGMCAFSVCIRVVYLALLLTCTHSSMQSR